jgi:hypothetical protein
MKNWSHNLHSRFACKSFNLTELRLLSRRTLCGSAQFCCILVLMLLVACGLVDDGHVHAAGFAEAAGCDNANADAACTTVAAPANGGHAIYVRDSGTFYEDGVVLPVFEDLEARYAAANQEFTVEYWFKLSPGYNSNGTELFDHHIPSEEGFWTAFQNGQLWAGIDTEPYNDSAAIHLQTGSGFNDGQWHHYALVRDLNASPDRLCLYLDGAGYCYADGSEPQWASVSSDIRPSNNRDGDPSNDYPLYVIGSRTSGGGSIEASIDELRISDVARYRSDFTSPTEPFTLDAHTVMLFHFDEGSGNTTYGYDSDNNPIEGLLVKNVGWYGVDPAPLDPYDPTDAAWLNEMWVSGHFDPSSPTPSLTLTAPQGGDTWTAGTQEQIEWFSIGDLGNVRLEYSTDSFATSHIIEDSTANDGTYTWTIPDDPSTNAVVKVSSTLTPTISDSSDVFTIAPPPLPILTLQKPDGGELWRTDTEHAITWSSIGTIANVSLRYSTDGFVTTSHSIVASTPNTGIYIWRTPVTPSKTVRVRVADADNPDIYDDSDTNFCLTDTIHYVYLPMILKQEW